MRRSIQLVTGALTSLRGATKCLHIFSDTLRFSVPAHTTIQNWILQYGLHQLTSPIERRSDWIFILDHTIEFGPQKCLLILGITMEEMVKSNAPVTQDQVRVLRAEISWRTSGEQIHEVLKKLIEETGAPVQIVSDGGFDLRKAIRLTSQGYPGIRTTYDITHKCGLILTHLLDKDMRWRHFQDRYARTKRKCVHSRFAFIAPKKLNDKSRWNNLDICVDWVQKVTRFRECLPQGIPALGQDAKGFARQFDATFGWLSDYREPIQQWSNILQVISIARAEVKTYGLQTDSAQRLIDKTKELPPAFGPVETVTTQLHMFLQDQTQGIAPGEKFLGASDVIESVFAKYKNFSARTPMKGIGKTVLTIPAFVGNITTEKVTAALGQVRIKTLTQWLDTNIGESIFAQRMKAFGTKNRCEFQTAS